MFNPEASRRIYTSRISHIITYITEHLGEELPLEVLARQACFSPYHFHRIFSALVGETPHLFVQRLRVERAAWMLQHHRALSVTEVALECGFSSSASLSRGFKKAFGMAPTIWQRSENRKICKTDRKNWKDSTVSGGYGGVALPMEPDQDTVSHQWNVSIVQMPAFHVAYIANLQGYSVDNILGAWKRLWQWASARDLLDSDTVELGVSLDDPQITPADKCRYYVCMTVPKHIHRDSIVGIMDIPGGKHAVYRFEGIQPELSAAYRGLYGQWLPTSGYQPAHSPCYEICRTASEDPMTEKMVMEIYVPVEPLSQTW